MVVELCHSVVVSGGLVVVVELCHSVVMNGGLVVAELCHSVVVNGGLVADLVNNKKKKLEKDWWLKLR